MAVTEASPLKSTTGRSLRIPGWLRSGLRLADAVAPDWAAQVTRQLYFRPPRLAPSAPEREVLAQGTRFALGHGDSEVVGRSFGSGPAVLLLHGWGGNMGQLAPYVGPLTRRGRRVVAVDWPAHGQSPGASTSLPRVAQALGRLQELVGGFEGVVAHSFGAPAVVLSMARGVPFERVALLAPAVVLARYFDRFSEAFGLSEPAKARFVAASEAWLGASVAAFEPLALARGLTAPLLVVHSEEDEETPAEDSRALAEAWPGARLELVRGLGHRRLLRDAKVVSQVTDFLTGAEAVAVDSAA